MEKEELNGVVFVFLYLLKGQGWLLEHIKTMELELMQATYVFMIMMDFHG